jgi:hypothetical protein
MLNGSESKKEVGIAYEHAIQNLGALNRIRGWQ